MENLARYIIRASFSQERLEYDAPFATFRGSHAAGAQSHPRATAALQKRVLIPYSAQQGLIAIRLVKLVNQVRLYGALGGGTM